ncbi:hypothetical protein [Streptomyces profundus]|uniref:hypothetical protein n=1 Tax=Streptomyces profundus TaxID=2867410 RepID=UPI001D1628EC|nr:hypothetical protein [Streptomyces sp. MA3_2.13]UED85612.1 hypothetical protein K4G22_16595 [Streptomyces sp. MA3_2.13]
MTDGRPEYVFDEVQIGRGLRPLAQHGFVIVDRGVLTLLGSDRRLIDSAPLATITGRPVRMTRGQTVSLTVNGTRYNVSPGWGARPTLVLPGDMTHVRTAAQALLHLIALPGDPTT